MIDSLLTFIVMNLAGYLQIFEVYKTMEYSWRYIRQVVLSQSPVSWNLQKKAEKRLTKILENLKGKGKEFKRGATKNIY